MNNIEQKIKTIISSTLNVDNKKVKDKSNFIDDLGADSLDSVEIIMNIEDEFNISISDEEATDILEVGQLIEVVKNKLQ